MKTYTLNGLSIDAYGYIKSTQNDIPTNLYAKNGGTDKDGLGIASDVDHEINKLTYIQLDLSGISNKVISGTVPNVTLQSIQKYEGFTIYGSNKLGNIGDLLYTSTDTPSSQTIQLPSFDKYRFFAITASGSLEGSNVLINSLDYMVFKEDVKSSN